MKVRWTVIVVLVSVVSTILTVASLIVCVGVYLSEVLYWLGLVPRGWHWP